MRGWGRFEYPDMYSSRSRAKECASLLTVNRTDYHTSFSKAPTALWLLSCGENRRFGAHPCFLAVSSRNDLLRAEGGAEEASCKTGFQSPPSLSPSKLIHLHISFFDYFQSPVLLVLSPYFKPSQAAYASTQVQAFEYNSEPSKC